RRADHADHGDALARHRHRRHPAQAGPRRGRVVRATGPAGMLVSAGSRVRVEAGGRAGLAEVAAAAGVTALAPAATGTAYDVRLVLEHAREPFMPGARVVTR